ncbi:MAG: nucleotidyltransferase domain-containing protein [Elusimicrobiaceae bacterium]
MERKFNLEDWLAAMLAGLCSAFGSRLLFAAHAGSWVRGEAGPSSDIDINVVLDEVTPYRRLPRHSRRHTI